MPTSSVPLPALVVGRERHELEDPLDVVVAEAGLEQPLGGRAADEALRARARVDPGRLDADDAPDALAEAAAMPISETISWVASFVTGVWRSSG